MLSILLILSNFFITEQPQYTLVIEKIDNRVEVFVNDQSIYESGFIEDNPEMDLRLSLNDLVSNPSNLVIKAYNGSDLIQDELDRHWEVRYSIFRDGEEVEFVWESSDGHETGLVYEQSYVLDDL